MSGRRIWWMLGLFVWAAFGSAACSYLDEDLALTDEEFEQSLEAGPQILDMGEMVIGGIGVRGHGYARSGSWGHHRLTIGERAPTRRSSIIVDSDAPADPREAAVSPEEEQRAWLAFEASGEDDSEPMGPTAMDRAFAGAGVHFVEAELARREDTTSVFAQAGVWR